MAPGKATLEQLRVRIAAIGRGRRHRGLRTLPLGVAAIDSLLPGGGLPLACVHEVASLDGAGLGFVLALLRRLGSPLPVLWCLRRPELYGPGLAALGFDPSLLILTRTRGKADLLWAMEEGLRCPKLAAVVAETGPLGGREQRRLQLAAEAGGVAGFVLREECGASTGAFFAASWRLACAPAGDGGPRWRVELKHGRGANGSWLVEWNHETGDLSLAAPVLDRPDRAQPGLAGGV